MSVRDAAGRHPRLTPDGPSTGDRTLGQRRPVGDPRTRARPTPPGGRGRLPGPLVVCLVAIGLAVVEALSGAPGLGGPAHDVIAGRSAPVTAAPPGRVGGGPTVTTEPRPAGDAPRRSDPSGLAPALPAASAPADLPPPCAVADRAAPNAGLDQWATTIVDTAFALPAGYRPPDLVPVGRSGIGGWGLVRSVVIDDLRALAETADDAGNPLAVQSAHRTRARQAEVFAGWVASSGEAAARTFSARPGHSEHELGTALDLRAAAGGAPWSGSFGSTAAGRWLARHAPEFGFVLSYPAGAEDLTCYGAEPWHVRYVGRAIAAEVAASGLPLRVWLWRFGEGR